MDNLLDNNVEKTALPQINCICVDIDKHVTTWKRLETALRLSIAADSCLHV